ncbi:hypothetical protein CI105_04975 [Candidatus Izimaplasma bacterium ZiA1]|uniref:dihydrofolate reductase n=1 Tax=Candidatus Izimoplasma sp. ZiA1 TaxID=2024899 RepID=UPI000BAA4E71|nr:hypothetical protein CI105_04975 [Candidatus Izimaplasma bacterium ZiA1]
MLSLIVAVDKNFGIGKDNKMPWHHKEDLMYFKKITLNKTVVMGRKTFESIVVSLGKPLPSRNNVVLSRGNFTFNNIEVINDITKYTNNHQDEEIFIIGGKTIYDLVINQVDRMYITFVDEEYDCDTFFSKVDFTKFRKIKETVSNKLTFTVFERVKI